MATTPYVHVPETVSAEAQAFLRAMPDPHLIPQFPAPDDLEGWKKLQAWADADGRAKSEPVLKALAPDVRPLTLGGIPALDIRPRGWTDNGKVLVYTHGGAHVMYSAASMLGRAAFAVIVPDALARKDRGPGVMRGLGKTLVFPQLRQ